jgi:UDP-N-acetylmuramoylalanine--D-glutamate ligase
MILKGKKIVVVGIGISGRAASLLLKKQGAFVYATDSRVTQELSHVAGELEAEGIRVELGKYTPDLVTAADLIVVSPGVKDDSDILNIAEKKSIPIISEIELASWFCKGPIIAVTGTNGKSTIVTLTGLMLKASGKGPVVCGNIGKVFSGAVFDIREGQPAVVEVSSFQLKRIDKFKPKIALIANITQNHFDWHGNFIDYFASKKNIYKNQDSSDFCILNYDDRKIKALEHELGSRVYYYSVKKKVKGAYLKGDDLILNTGANEMKICSISDIELPGSHNVPNMLACTLCSHLAGAHLKDIVSALTGFKGLDHRFQQVSTIDGVRYINDSKATTVGACKAALNSCAENVILIAGGRDKGSDYKVIKELIRDKVKSIILIGEAKEKIRADLADPEKRPQAVIQFYFLLCAQVLICFQIIKIAETRLNRQY